MRDVDASRGETADMICTRAQRTLPGKRAVATHLRTLHRKTADIAKHLSVCRANIFVRIDARNWLIKLRLAYGLHRVARTCPSRLPSGLTTSEREPDTECSGRTKPDI